MDIEKCKVMVPDRQAWHRECRCTRKATKDGYCKQHHPDAKAERDRISREKYEIASRRQAMGFYGERFMAALIKIRDGDNDPRETAKVALKGCRHADIQP